MAYEYNLNQQTLNLNTYHKHINRETAKIKPMTSISAFCKTSLGKSACTCVSQHICHLLHNQLFIRYLLSNNSLNASNTLN